MRLKLPPALAAWLGSIRGQLQLIGGALLAALVLGAAIGTQPGFFRGTQALKLSDAILAGLPADKHPQIQAALNDGAPSPDLARELFLRHPAEARALLRRALLAGTPDQRRNAAQLAALADSNEAIGVLAELAHHAARTGDDELAAAIGPALAAQEPDIFTPVVPPPGPDAGGAIDE